MGFPHAHQLGRVDRIRELKGGKQELETVWIITSLTADQAEATRLLELVRLYWSIEKGTHYPLDVSSEPHHRANRAQVRWSQIGQKSETGHCALNTSLLHLAKTFTKGSSSP